IEQARQQLTQRLVVQIPAGDGADMLPRIHELCRAHGGRCPLFVQVSSPANWVVTLKSARLAVDISDPLLAALGGSAGAENVLCYGSRGSVSAAIANGATVAH